MARREHMLARHREFISCRPSHLRGQWLAAAPRGVGSIAHPEVVASEVRPATPGGGAAFAAPPARQGRHSHPARAAYAPASRGGGCSANSREMVSELQADVVKSTLAMVRELSEARQAQVAARQVARPPLSPLATLAAPPRRRRRPLG